MLTAAGGTIDGIGKDTGDEVLTLTLSGVNDHATQFADRPARDAYVISTLDFADRWDDWFGSTPPNAVLSYQVAGEARPRGIVLEIDDPEYDSGAGTITFVARHLHRGSDPHPDAIAPIEVARRGAPASFRSASLFIDSAGDSAAPTSLDPSAAAAPETSAGPAASSTPAASPSSTVTASAASSSPADTTPAASLDAPSSPDSSTLTDTEDVATILGRVTPTGVDLGDGRFVFDPSSTSTPAGATVASGRDGNFESKVNANPATSTFAYQVYELGAATGIWVRGTAQANPPSYLSRDTSSCDFFRGDPASGAAQISDDSQPYACVMTYLTTADEGEYVVRYAVAPKIWATVRGSITPTGGVALRAGQVSAENVRWDFNGRPVTGPLAVDLVRSTTPDSWVAYHRGGDTNLNSARVDFSYQIVDGGNVTPYWVAGHTENYRGAEFDHDGVCTIFDANPLTSSDAKEPSLSPYSCDAVAANVDGRGDWKVDFTVSAKPATVVDAVLQPAVAKNLLADACADTGASCAYLPTRITDANVPGVRVSKKTANTTSEPVEAAVEWAYRHAVKNSLGVEVDTEDTANAFVAKVTVAVKVKWSIDVTNTYTTTTTNTLTVPPGCASWWMLSPAYKVVDGDFVLVDGGTLYRIKGVSWTLPEAAASGNDAGLMQGTLTAVSEPVEGSKATCSMPATAAGAAG